jgi:hypothetical protein
MDISEFQTCIAYSKHILDGNSPDTPPPEVLATVLSMLNEIANFCKADTTELTLRKVAKYFFMKLLEKGDKLLKWWPEGAEISQTGVYSNLCKKFFEATGCSTVEELCEI